MKSIISGAVLATAIVACLSLNVQAKSINRVAATTSVSDTGKMSKMSKMDKKKMPKGKMSSKKMSKDSTGKM
jgi:hypothetical protein